MEGGKWTDPAHGLDRSVLMAHDPKGTCPAAAGTKLAAVPCPRRWNLAIYVRFSTGWPDRMQPGSPLRTRLFRSAAQHAVRHNWSHTLATAPLTALWFGQFVATGAIANCIVVPTESCWFCRSDCSD